MDFPILSVIIFTPMVAALILLMMPADRKTEIRVTALVSGAFALLLSLWVYIQYLTLGMTGYQFVEIAVFPMYLLIAIWGWVKTREYAAMKLTLYLFIGSVIALVGALAMYFTSGMGTFDMLMLETANFSVEFQKIWFLPVFLGFAVLGGIWPFHNWSPDGRHHVAA